MLCILHTGVGPLSAKVHSPIRRGSPKVGWEEAVLKSHINFLILFERTIEQTTEIMALLPTSKKKLNSSYTSIVNDAKKKLTV